MNKSKRIILASNSPRRSELLALSGRRFEVQPADVNENQLPGEDPAAYVLRVAQEKATAIAKREQGEGWVLAADTVVVDDGEILGKPADAEEARQVLTRLRGRSHVAMSAIVLLDLESGAVRTDVAESRVPMREYTDAEIESYIASGDPFDKAGSYGIQNEDFAPVEQFKQCFANVMGLPLCHLQRNLAKENAAFDVDIAVRCQKHLGYDCPVYEEILTWKQ